VLKHLASLGEILKVSEEIAKRDGFNFSKETREWFNKTPYPEDEELFDVIRL
jgi:hypothetical protein